jgi:hypothetical protein
MALRSRRHPTPPRQGDRTSSEGRRAPFQSGQDHPASRDQANGAPRSTARRVSPGWAPALGARQTAPFGESRAAPQRDREPAALRSRWHPASRVGTPRLSGSGRRRSSEHRAQDLTGAGPLTLFGATATRHRSGQSHGDTGPPAPWGRPERQAMAGNHRCTSPASVCGDRQGNRPRSGTAPGRTVTAGRQRPQ